jgi:hypothetical protein
MKSNSSWARLAIAFLVLVVSVPAFADRIYVPISTSLISWAGGTGYMATYPDSSTLRFIDNNTVGATDFPYWLPSFNTYGQKIRSAELYLSFPSLREYSYNSRIEEVWPVDPRHRSVPGRVETTITTRNVFEGISLWGSGWECSSYGGNPRYVDLLAIGCGSYWDGPVTPMLTFYSETWSVPTVIDPGFNSETYFQMNGGHETPVRGYLEVEYGAPTPVTTPEPGSWVLLGTGMVLLAIPVLRRRAF